MSDEAHALACEFQSALDEGGAAIGEKFYEMGSQFPEIQRSSVKAQIISQLSNFKITETDIYRIADLNGLLTEYFMLARTKAHGILYFRLRFEPIHDKIVLYHFNFNDDIDKVTTAPFLQPPEPISCS